MIEILHGRDPDSSCEIDVFVDGEYVQSVVIVDIDPGSGWVRAEWDEHVAESLASLSPNVRLIAEEAFERYSDSKYIEDH